MSVNVLCTDDHQIGFVPDATLLYVLPEGVRAAAVWTAQSAQPRTGQPPQQSTAGAPPVNPQPPQR